MFLVSNTVRLFFIQFVQNFSVRRKAFSLITVLSRYVSIFHRVVEHRTTIWGGNKEGHETSRSNTRRAGVYTHLELMF